MITKEAIVLAGGLGTRMQSVLPDTPKSMALINDAPFFTLFIGLFDQAGDRECNTCSGL